MEKPFPVVSEDASLTEVAQRMDRETPAILVRQQGGFDIITKSDLIFFLTRRTQRSRRLSPPQQEVGWPKAGVVWSTYPVTTDWLLPAILIPSCYIDVVFFR